VPGPTSPSSTANTYNVLKAPFPISTTVPTTHALCGALVGRFHFDDAEVRRERDILFGDDDNAVRRFIRHARAELAANAFIALRRVWSTEQHYYGISSF
jgi:hypothetical protein